MMSKEKTSETIEEQKSSTTALLIILMALSDKDKRPNLVAEETVALYKKVSALLLSKLPEENQIKQISEQPLKEQRKAFRDMTMAGSTLQIAMRKLLVKQQIEEFVNSNQAGANIVVLGAGFDFLSYLMHKNNPHVNFLEVDMEGTSKSKQEALQNLGDNIGSNLKFAACTLGEDSINRVLTRDNGFDESKPTLVIAEGVLEFLKEGGVRDLFTSISDIATDGSKVIFSVQEGNLEKFNDGEKANKTVVTIANSLPAIAESGVNITGKATHHYLQMKGRGINVDDGIYSIVDKERGNGVSELDLRQYEVGNRVKLNKHSSLTNAEHFFVGEFTKEEGKPAPELQNIPLVKIDVPMQRVM
jgi:methyltransferase (TIGR00027 family)